MFKDQRVIPDKLQTPTLSYKFKYMFRDIWGEDGNEGVGGDGLTST